VSDFKDFAVGLKNGFVNVIKALTYVGSGIAKVYGAIKDMGKWIGEGIGSMAGGVLNFIKGIVPDWMLPDSMKSRRTIKDANGKEVEVDSNGNPVKPEETNTKAVTAGELTAYGVAGAVAYKPLAAVGRFAKNSFINSSLAASKASGTVSAAAKAASSAMSAAPVSKVKTMLETMKNKILKKVGPVAGGKLLGKIASRFVPVAGLALLAYDAAMIAKDMISNGTEFKIAVSNQVLGFNIFDDSTPILDINGNPIKPNIEETNQPVNNSNYSGGKQEQSLFSKLKTSVSNKISSIGSSLSDGWEAAKKYVTSGIGSIAAYFESGAKGAGAVSSGVGDHGGASYGTFQLSSKTGTLQKYLAGSKYREEFIGLIPGTPAFNAKWKSVYENDKEGFAKDQEAFIAKTHYEPQVDKLRGIGLDVANRPSAVKSSVFSVGVQFGPNSNLIPNALAANNIDPTNVTDSALVRSIYKYKQDNNDTLFRSSSDNVRSGTLSRSHKEEKLVNDMLGNSTINTSSDTTTPTVENNIGLSKTIDNVKTDTTSNINTNINKDLMSESNVQLGNIATVLTKSLDVQLRMASALDKLVENSNNIDISKITDIKPVNNRGSTELPEPAVSMKRKNYTTAV